MSVCLSVCVFLHIADEFVLIFDQSLNRIVSGKSKSRYFVKYFFFVFLNENNVLHSMNFSQACIFREFRIFPPRSHVPLLHTVKDSETLAAVKADVTADVLNLAKKKKEEPTPHATQNSESR